MLREAGINVSQSPQIGASLRTFVAMLREAGINVSQSPQIGASLRTDVSKQHQLRSYVSQSPQIGASLRTQTTLNFGVALLDVCLNPLKSGQAFGHIAVSKRKSSQNCLNPLKSGQAFGLSLLFPPIAGDIVSIPSNRGKPSDDLILAKGNYRILRSQSPQIGASLRTFLTKRKENGL